ncbi:MAG: hypothetical protein OEZ59_05525 [Deltaproteobacteria bacterium]|nr:hypothetical protein [Deltaproteobacteria bacterium]
MSQKEQQEKKVSGEAPPANAGNSVAIQEMNQRFAWLEKAGEIIGFWGIIAAFILYVTGLVKPYIPISDMIHSWGLSVDEFVAKTNSFTGWSWAPRMFYSDYLSMAGLAFLSSVVIFAYAGLIPLLLKHKDKKYLGLVLAQLFIFILAASGILEVE